ncbi:MAG: hypothetical protein ACK5HD_01875 [Bacteroidota bacterium]|jgi:hypothetical protein
MKKSILLIATCLFIISVSRAQCYSAGEHLPNTGLLSITSGYRDLDSIVVSEIFKLERFYGVNVDFYFLLEDYSKNAMYIHECNQACNGTICLGIKMLYSELKKTNGLYTTKAILAHEFGHCIQHVIGWKEGGKRPELHSDFMAGYYLGKNYEHTAQELDVLFNNFYEIGDKQYWSISHHGTGTERECAFREGYCFAKETKVHIDYANSYAIQYVVADNPCGIRKYKAWEQIINNDADKSKIIKEKNKGQDLIKNLATTTRTAKLTFNSNNGYYYEVWAPGIGKLGSVSDDNPVTVIVDMNCEYKFLYKKFRRTLSGKKGALKTEHWRVMQMPWNDVDINIGYYFN